MIVRFSRVFVCFALSLIVAKIAFSHSTEEEVARDRFCFVRAARGGMRVGSLLDIRARSDDPIRVLSLDGGGVRGIMTAKHLERAEMYRRCPTALDYDFIVATSTGGVIAAALTQPSLMRSSVFPLRSSTDVVGLYKTFATRVFPTNALSHPRKVIGLVWGPKYSAEPLEDILAEELGAMRLRDCCTNVMITSVDAITGCTRLFRSYRARHHILDDEDLAMTAVCRATTAAPSFFPPAEVAGHHLLDGGLAVNNPSLVAYAEVKRLFPERSIQLISLGTGMIDPKKSAGFSLAGAWTGGGSHPVDHRGKIFWAKPTIDTLMLTQSETAHNTLRVIAGTDPRFQYWRYQYKKLKKELKPLDKAKNIEQLEAIRLELDS